MSGEERTETRILAADRPEDMREAARLLREGSLVAFPTETVYGLGANGLMPEAVNRIFKVKGRPSDNPLILHIADRKMLEALVSRVDPGAYALMDAWWPGPLTLVFEAADSVPDAVRAGLPTVAVRMPASPEAAELIRLAGVPVAAPSANLSGRPSPTRADHVLRDLEGRVEAILTGADAREGLESTIVDVSRRPFSLLRPGSITLEELRKKVPDLQVDPALERDTGEAPRAPGMKYRHYSPDARVTLFEGTLPGKVKFLETLKREDPGAGVISTRQLREAYRGEPFGYWYCLGDGEDPSQAARRIYDSLREADRAGVEEVYVEAFPEQDLGRTIMNRLRKAASGRIRRCD